MHEYRVASRKQLIPEEREALEELEVRLFPRKPRGLGERLLKRTNGLYLFREKSVVGFLRFKPSGEIRAIFAVPDKRFFETHGIQISEELIRQMVSSINRKRVVYKTIFLSETGEAMIKRTLERKKSLIEKITPDRKTKKITVHLKPESLHLFAPKLEPPKQIIRTK